MIIWQILPIHQRMLFQHKKDKKENKKKREEEMTGIIVNLNLDQELCNMSPSWNRVGHIFVQIMFSEYAHPISGDLLAYFLSEKTSIL